jgi:DNA-binding response OmpR family regulator
LTNRILVVDDEPTIVDLVRQLLIRHGHEVITASDGDDALQVIYDSKPDLVVLDLMLPKLSGWEVCRRVKEDKEVRDIPILMLTARREDKDLVEGLGLGADDYVKKPFSTAELGARIATILRRSNEEKTAKRLSSGDLDVDLENSTVTLRGAEVSLSPTEFRLLEALMKRAGKMVTRDNLLACIWNSLECETRTIDVHISRLRKKLDDGKTPALTIHTQRGLGYRLIWEAASTERTARKESESQ